jgi:carbonic anhydrase
MFTKIKNDLPAGLVVFLVALPLCLGVALASGAPLLSGVISGIIGGIVVGILSQSHASVSGPAAGLAAVVLASIAQLGQFEVFLLSVVLAGAIQLVIGLAKGGFIANYIPSNVIKGLLAAIGITLIIKQIPHAVGFDRNAAKDFALQQDVLPILGDLFHFFACFSWGSIIVSAFSILIMLYWDKTPMNKVKFFPASLFVVLLGVALNFIFKTYFPTLYISTAHLVKMPLITDVSALITLPAFDSIYNPNVWIVAFTIAVIASLETLLNLEAVENIDPHKRHASPNRELIAQGIGNILSGMIGGIPITSVIVRSSVNIGAGAATKMSAILHGIFLAISVLLLSPFLNLIPLAALASILLLTGYKLAKVSIFTDMYKKGQNQLIPFLATIVGILLTDLLIGVLIGLAINIFYLLKNNYSNPFVLEKETLHVGETIRMKLPNQVTFLNKTSIKTTLWEIPQASKVIIDATYCDFIDDDILELIDNYKTTISANKAIQLKIIGLKQHYQWDDQVPFNVNALKSERD